MDVSGFAKPSVCFQVQKIIGISLDGNTRNYQVQWAPTWVTWHHLVGCEDLIDEFIALQNSSQQKEMGDTALLTKVFQSSTAELEDSNNVELLQHVHIKEEIENDLTPSLLTTTETESYIQDENVNIHDTFSVSNTNINASIDPASDKRLGPESTSISGSVDAVGHFQTSQEDDVGDIVKLNEGLAEQEIGKKEYIQINKEGIGDIVKFKGVAEQEIRKKYLGGKRYSGEHCIGNTSLKNISRTFIDINQDSLTLGYEIDHNNVNFPNNDNNMQYDSEQLKGDDYNHSNQTYKDKPGSLGSIISNNSEVCSDLEWDKLNLFNKCSVCGKVYSCKSALKRHLRTHANDRRYKCTVCGKGYYQSHDLKRHMRVHTGEKPFICVICDRTFSLKNGLTKHMVLHQQESKM